MLGHSLSVKGRRIRWGGLALALTPLIGVLFYRLGVKPLPINCLFKWLIGIPSPGCGMTRSLLALTRGDWQQSFKYHLFGPVLFLGCIFVVTQISVELFLGRTLTIFKGQAFSDCYRNVLGKLNYLGAILGLFLVYYAIRLFARYGSIKLPFGFEHSAWWQWVASGAKAL